MSKRGKYTREDAERERLAHGSNSAEDMPPEDKVGHADGRKYGAAHAAEFCAAHAEEMRALIATYPDALAEHLFQDLRDLFWSRYWQPAAQPSEKTR